jgi:hypothetical protein
MSASADPLGLLADADGEACALEPLLQGGLAFVPGAQLAEPLAERVRIPVTLSECLQVSQQP